MRLSKFCVQNFRCIERLEFSPKAFSSLIGPNNAGKSSVLRALVVFLNQLTPASDEWRVGHEAEPIVLEAEFDDLAEWERTKPGVSGLVFEDRIRLRMSVTSPNPDEGKRKAEITYECFKPQETITGWADAWATLAPTLKEKAAELGITGTSFRNVASKERLRQLIRDTAPELVTNGAPRWTTEGISIPAAFQQAIPQAQLIPAVRDAEEDGAPGASTSFGLLLKSIVLPAVAASDEYQSLMRAVSDLERKLRGDGAEQIPAVQQLADSISQRLSDLITAKVRLGMDPPDAEKFIGANTVLRLDDGTVTRIALQGHGLQRALVFAMLEVLASQSAAANAEAGQPPNLRKTILLFEEPELFIHPHLMRRLHEVLARIARRPEWQVIVSTHSPFLIDIADDPTSLVILRRPDPRHAPRLTQLSTNPFTGVERTAERERLRALLDFHPTVCEAFFAKHVVLVEGDTEIASLVRQDALYALCGVDPDVQRDTTIVSCDGKWTIIPIARLLRAFGIPVRVIHDIDRKGRSMAELEADASSEWHANQRIREALGNDELLAVDDTFEHLLWNAADAPTTSKDKPFRAWKRVRDLCEGRQSFDHQPGLRDAVRFAFQPFAPPAIGGT